MRGAVSANSDGEVIEVEPDEDGPLVAYVFKTLADPYTGRVNLFRVYRGTMRSDSSAVNVTRGEKERLGQLTQAVGKDLKPVQELGAGDIGAVAKL
jgi:elongation factor G